MSLFPDLPQPETKADIARRIFDYWKHVTNHPRSHMDAKRQNLITARLADGYSEADLKLAALGVANSPWHQGQNPERKVYDSVELCYRNADKVDMLIREGENAQAREKRRIANERTAAVESIKLSTTGEVYKENRGALLRLVKRNQEAA